VSSRHQFISLLSAAAAAWPVAARAQQGERMRRVGMLMSALESDPTAMQNITSFAQRLAELGCIAGRNMRIDYRCGAGDLDIALFADQPTGRKRIVTQRRLAAGDVHSCTTRQWRGDAYDIDSEADESRTSVRDWTDRADVSHGCGLSGHWPGPRARW
jgi:hypothetical protein